MGKQEQCWKTEVVLSVYLVLADPDLKGCVKLWVQHFQGGVGYLEIYKEDHRSGKHVLPGNIRTVEWGCQRKEN